MKKYIDIAAISIVVLLGAVALFPQSQGFKDSSGRKMTDSGQIVTNTQPGTLRNSSTTGATNTAVTASIAAVSGQSVNVYAVEMYCSAGTATLQIKNGVAGTVIWQTAAAASSQRVFFTPLASTTGNGLDAVGGTCGVGNTTTLSVQASQF